MTSLEHNREPRIRVHQGPMNTHVTLEGFGDTTYAQRTLRMVCDGLTLRQGDGPGHLEFFGRDAQQTLCQFQSAILETMGVQIEMTGIAA